MGRGVLLPIGAYEIATAMPGFKQQVRSGINLVVGQQAVINLTLEVGAAAVRNFSINSSFPLTLSRLESI